MIPFPNIDPVLIRLGPLAIRWYSLAYVGGILLGWWVVLAEHARKPVTGLTKQAVDDMVMWAVGGIILGGRLGYVLFYKPEFYFANPLQILHVWEGGMSFHGGLIGAGLAFVLFCRKYHIVFFELADLLVCAGPIGLGLGRIANFINGELYGRTTDVAWGIVFPRGGELPRHPSQLYEAGLEGIVLFALLMYLLKFTRARERVGFLSGMFLVGYAVSRIIVECFREPDDFLGFLFGGVTMGQLLCLPMLAFGIYLMVKRREPRHTA